MELKDFVATTLEEIYAGIEKADEKVKKHFAIYGNGPNVKNGGITFDLAVSSEEVSETTRKAEGGLRIKVVSAEAGKQGSSTTSAGSISRVVFVVNPRS